MLSWPGPEHLMPFLKPHQGFELNVYAIVDNNVIQNSAGLYFWNFKYIFKHK